MAIKFFNGFTNMAGKKTRIMYIEQKTGPRQGWQLAFGPCNGDARIGRVRFSKTGKTIYYKDRAFESLGGRGVSGNYYDTETGAEYWISGPKKNGQDRHWAEPGPVIVDEDVAEEYWRDIRGIDRSVTQLARLAQEALAEHRSGQTEELDPERL